MSESLECSAIVSDGADSVLDDLIETLTARLQAGEPVDLDEVARRHPEYAERLRRLLPALVMMADLGDSSPRELEGIDASGPGPGPGVLGDFRILREVGRGGMGDRLRGPADLARPPGGLKVLPMAAAMDASSCSGSSSRPRPPPACTTRTSCRCTPSAASAACRSTPCSSSRAAAWRRSSPSCAGSRAWTPADAPAADLADILTSTLAADWSVGDWPGGTGRRSGRDRSERTSDRPDRRRPHRLARRHPGPAASPPPAPRPAAGTYIRTVAQLGVQAAEALDHAHTRGILHRDIKPANLLLDDKGQFWVTDFGLAQIQGNPGLTLTGDILGTLRYMSPEQALAKRVVIDGRTDIYSLGVTLYELLTLRPAFDGQDRQEILRKIAEEEPAPPRKLNPAVPRDLETIVLKAMAKDPAGGTRRPGSWPTSCGGSWRTSRSWRGGRAGSTGPRSGREGTGRSWPRWRSQSSCSWSWPSSCWAPATFESRRNGDEPTS